MARRGSDEEEETSEEDEEEEDHPRRRARHHRRKGEPAGGITPWSPDGEEGGEGGSGWFHRGPKRPVYWRARDSLWFEPLVALAILLLLLVALWAYTQNWPPVYVIESESMQHGTNDVLGVINTGDLVLAQKIDATKITPYMVGVQNGYQTYGEYGDVLLYYPNGDTSVTPIIHRALLFLEWNTLNNTDNAPAISPLPCSPLSHPYYRTSSTLSTCATSGIAGQLTLYNVGWQGVTVSVDVGELGSHSGFLTMGDNNYLPGNPGTGDPDEPVLSSLVEPGWVLGVARGMIPWFGALKLLLQGDTSMVPSQSWQFLGLSLAGIVLVGLAIHLAVRRIERRREEERGGEEPLASEAHVGLLARLLERAHLSSEEEEDEDDKPAHPTRHRGRTVRVDPRRLAKRGGRPKPHTRRDEHEHKRSDGSHHRRSSDDEDDSL
ncbi:MAG: S26 family signal peptidase [Thermoplasmata archaeon]|nr:S26 family signal peptidase [Thermoplasmata archaeon]